MRPVETARITTIDSYQDLMTLGRQYGWEAKDYPVTPGLDEGWILRMASGGTARLYSLNFEAMTGDYDAIHLTEAGLKATDDKSDPYGLSNCHSECTIWFRWMFDEVEEIRYFWEDFPKRWHDEATRYMSAGVGLY